MKKILLFLLLIPVLGLAQLNGNFRTLKVGVSPGIPFKFKVDANGTTTWASGAVVNFPPAGSFNFSNATINFADAIFNNVGDGLGAGGLTWNVTQGATWLVNADAGSVLTLQSGSQIVSFTGGSGGLVYGADYSAGFGNRSLIDKAYITTIAFLDGSVSLNFPNTAAQTSSDLTVTVTGAFVGANPLPVSIGVNPTAVNANSNFTAWVSAANVVTVRFNNYSAAAIDPAAAIFHVKVWTF